MKKSEFIQLYLKEKGVSTWLTKPYPLLFSKLTKTKYKLGKRAVTLKDSSTDSKAHFSTKSLLLIGVRRFTDR